MMKPTLMIKGHMTLFSLMIFLNNPSCNIPLVSIGILPVERIREQMFMRFTYNKECLVMQCQLNEGLIINVKLCTLKRRVNWYMHQEGI